MAPFLIASVWLAFVAVVAVRLQDSERLLVLCASSIPACWTWLVTAWQRRGSVELTIDQPPAPKEDSGAHPSLSTEAEGPVTPSTRSDLVVTRSGLYPVPMLEDPSSGDTTRTGEFPVADMVNRLEPVAFHWLDSSLAEQQFLGWPLSALKSSSYLQIIHPDDRVRARDAFQLAIARGESLGMVFRIKTARGETKAVEVNASARYTSEHQVSYLRCHITDVTEKIRGERELRLRSRELIRLNEQLRGINRELEELKDRYSELYDSVPAMCFSLDSQGRVIECNKTFLSVLRLRREEILGKSFEAFTHPEHHERGRRRFSELLKRGTLEAEGRWVLKGGGTIDVWGRGTVVRGVGEGGDQVRCVAEDVTAKHRLEAEIRETNRSLALANAELSVKNQDLDEFVYVVSHDLQEPLRTLQVFSDFLLRDHADQINAEGRQLIHHLADASRRLQAMVTSLLNLARAGKVAGEFGDIPFHDLVETVKADLGARIRDRRAIVEIEGPDVTLRGEPWRIQRLFANLISNGIKYNQSEAPRIVVGFVGIEGPPTEADGVAAGGPPMARLFVRDNGIGIDPRNHQKIFHLFRRLHSSDEYEGIGAGLAICSKIVQAHGGTIGVESQLGAGATFFISLPIAPGGLSGGDGEPAESPATSSGDVAPSDPPSTIS